MVRLVELAVGDVRAQACRIGLVAAIVAPLAMTWLPSPASATTEVLKSRCDGSWQPTSGVNLAPYGLSFASANDGWVVGEAGPGGSATYHWDGQRWLPRGSGTPRNGGRPEPRAVATASTTTFVVGTTSFGGTANSPFAERWTSGRWVVDPVPTPAPGAILWAVAAVSDVEAWAVGEMDDPTSAVPRQPEIEHYVAGTGWTFVPLGPGTFDGWLSSVAVVSASEVVAVGPGLLAKWDGTQWTIGGNQYDYAVAASGGQVWEVGGANMPTGPGNSDFLYSVAAIPGDVWAVGEATSGVTRSGTYLAVRLEGSEWVADDAMPNLPGALNAVAISSPLDTWAASPQGGSLLHRCGPPPSWPPRPVVFVMAANGALTGQASLNWYPSSSDGGSPIDAYAIYAYSPNGTVETQVMTGPSNRAYLTGLTSGADYVFTVSAHNSVGWGAWSDWSQASEAGQWVQWLPVS